MPLNQLGNQEVSQLKKQFDVEPVEARIERLEKAVSNLTRLFLIHMPREEYEKEMLTGRLKYEVNDMGVLNKKVTVPWDGI